MSDWTEFLKPYRGSYVRIKTESICPTSVIDTYAVGRPKDGIYRDKGEGILSISRQGQPKIDGHLVSWKTIQKIDIEIIFKPAKNVIKTICTKCADGHPLMEHLKAARVLDGYYSNLKSSPCRCGRIDVFKIPSRFWWVTWDTVQETIEKELAPLVFSRKMKDWNAELRLSDVRKNIHQSRALSNYTLTWWSKSGEVVHSYHDNPPTVLWWENWIELSEVKKDANRVNINHHTVYEQSEST